MAEWRTKHSMAPGWLSAAGDWLTGGEPTEEEIKEQEEKERQDATVEQYGTQSPKGVTDDLTKALKALMAAGANPEANRIVSANPGLASLIASHPELAQYWAQRYPDADRNVYQQTEAMEFGASNLVKAAGYTDPFLSGSATGGTTETASAKRLKNGVIIKTDPSTGTQSVLYPDDPMGKVAGSPTWLSKVTEWKDERVATWREILESHGYLTEAKGGITRDFVNALANFHQDRYVFGKALKSDSAGRDKPELKDAIDKHEIRQAVRQQFLATFEDPGTDQEIDDWSKWFENKANELIRKKGYTPEHAATSAAARVENKIVESPEGQLYEDQRQDGEENTRLRDSLLSIGQIVGM